MVPTINKYAEMPLHLLWMPIKTTLWTPKNSRLKTLSRLSEKQIKHSHLPWLQLITTIIMYKIKRTSMEFHTFNRIRLTINWISNKIDTMEVKGTLMKGSNWISRLTNITKTMNKRNNLMKLKDVNHLNKSKSSKTKTSSKLMQH